MSPESLTAAPELEAVARRFPNWLCSRDTDRLCSAVLRGSDPAVVVRGEDPVDLADQIQGYLYRQERTAGLTPAEAADRSSRAAFVMREVGVLAAELARTAHACARAADRRDPDAMCATAEALLELEAFFGSRYREFLKVNVKITRSDRPVPPAPQKRPPTLAIMAAHHAAGSTSSC